MSTSPESSFPEPSVAEVMLVTDADEAFICNSGIVAEDRRGLSEGGITVMLVGLLEEHVLPGKDRVIVEIHRSTYPSLSEPIVGVRVEEEQDDSTNTITLGYFSREPNPLHLLGQSHLVVTGTDEQQTNFLRYLINHTTWDEALTQNAAQPLEIEE
jgi:hypothetical protein